MENIINSIKLTELGDFLSNELNSSEIKKSELSIEVDEQFFKKIDEDIYFRFNTDNDKEPFVPSETEIELDFPNLSIKIKKSMSN